MRKPIESKQAGFDSGRGQTQPNCWRDLRDDSHADSFIPGCIPLVEFGV